jgi:hypothetical protein
MSQRVTEETEIDLVRAICVLRRQSLHPSRFMLRDCKITVDKGIAALSIYRNKKMAKDNDTHFINHRMCHKSEALKGVMQANFSFD